MRYSRAQVKVTSPEMRGCARARDLVVDGLKGTNYTVSPIKPSEHGGFHAFINLEFELEATA